MKKHFLLISSIVALTAGCSRKDQDKIGDAQTCLDTATRATVATCVEKVNGLESSQAYLIRCAAKFIEEGFDDASRLSSAYQQMTNSGTGGSGIQASQAVMSVLAFKSAATTAANSANATLAQNYCNLSTSKGLILLASIASMSTKVLALTSQPSCSGGVTQQCIQDSMAAAASDPAAQAAIGQATVDAYNSNCSGGQQSNAQFCNQFQEVVNQTPGGTSNSACIGKKMMEYYGQTGGGGGC